MCVWGEARLDPWPRLHFLHRIWSRRGVVRGNSPPLATLPSSLSLAPRHPRCRQGRRRRWLPALAEGRRIRQVGAGRGQGRGHGQGQGAGQGRLGPGGGGQRFGEVRGSLPWLPASAAGGDTDASHGGTPLPSRGCGARLGLAFLFFLFFFFLGWSD